MKYKVASRLSYDDNRPFVREHVIIAEKKLGRRLNRSEVVHHIDGNKENNNPDNLMVFATKADHSAFHKGADAICNNEIWFAQKKTIICENCGKEFIPMYHKKYLHVYCSKRCSQISRMKSEELSKNELYLLLKNNNGNFTVAGKILGISDNAVRKRCKHFGLPIHSSKYK